MNGVVCVWTRINGHEKCQRVLSSADGRKVLVIEERDGCQIIRPIRWEV